MENFTISLAKLSERINMEVVYTPRELSEIHVEIAEVNRPGLFLAGYYEYFDNLRLQIMGLAEMNFLSVQTAERRYEALDHLFGAMPPAVIVSRSDELTPFPEMIELAQKYKVALLRSNEASGVLMGNLLSVLNMELAPRITRHGVLVEVYGEGVLLTGESGVGKSETAIELVKRGHRLIADDAVEIRRGFNNRLVGTAPELIRHYIELRGIGVVDVRRLFGMSAVKFETNIDMLVKLENWQEGAMYDRLGADEFFTEVMGVELPTLTIPVKPGRNLAVILEVAAMNNRNKKMGHNAALEFTRQIDAHIDSQVSGR